MMQKLKDDDHMFFALFIMDQNAASREIMRKE